MEKMFPGFLELFLSVQSEFYTPKTVVSYSPLSWQLTIVCFFEFNHFYDSPHPSLPSKFLSFVCIGDLPAWMSVHHVCLVPWGQKKVLDFCRQHKGSCAHRWH